MLSRRESIAHTMEWQKWMFNAPFRIRESHCYHCGRCEGNGHNDGCPNFGPTNTYVYDSRLNPMTGTQWCKCEWCTEPSQSRITYSQPASNRWIPEPRCHDNVDRAHRSSETKTQAGGQEFIPNADPRDPRAVHGYRYPSRKQQSEFCPQGIFVIPRRSARIATAKRKRTT